MSKKKAIMLADNRISLVGQMLIQIRNTNRDLIDEVIVMDVGISESDKEIMRGIMPCKFIKYTSPLPYTLFETERFKRFSEVMFARYEMFHMLDEYSMIMWLDTDIVIQGSLEKLMEASAEKPMAILREDPQNKSAKNTDVMRTNFFRAVDGYNMDSYLYCTGMIIVRDSLKQECDYTKWCYEKTVEWADNLNLPDQGVINALFQEFDFEPYPIGQGGKYGCFPYYGRDCREAVVVHSWGKNKFWNDWYLNQRFPVWEKCYKEWVELGGSSMERNMMPEISIVMPIYKPDLGYFKQCIESIYAQKREEYELYSNYELIIVAEPFEEERITEFVESYHDPRFKLLFNEERLGIAASLNRGIKEARGKYVLRIDDDDIAAPMRFQKQYEYMEMHPDIHLCTTDYMYFGDMNEGRVAFEGEMSRAWSVLTCPFDHPTIMFRRDFFVENDLFYDENRGYVEDWELWQRAFKKGMKVGCINEILFYHRWHNGSAGQTNKTVEMMRQMIQSNMKELGVEIPDEHLWMFGPWNGKVTSKEDYNKLETYFRQAIKNNEELKLYDTFCLARAFSLRLSEAMSGCLGELVIPAPNNSNIIKEVKHNTGSNEGKGSLLKRGIKRIFKPLYRPIYNRYESRIANIQEMSWRTECGLNDMRNNIESLKDDAGNMSRFITEEIQRVTVDYNQNLENQLKALKEMIDYEKLQPQFDMVHRHIDFEARDILVALERASTFLPYEDVRLETEHPVAFESLDHLYPRGTVQDDTRYPRFVRKCEEIMGTSKKLRFLDLGCSGGGMVLEALLRGHMSYGLEGSDCSLKEQRAEWRLIGNHLMTCDITKPFRLCAENEETYKFDVITAWEVMEHLAEEDLEGLFDNLRSHLREDGLFVASIANWDDIDPETGVNWHVTVHPYEWWKEKFEQAGFEVYSELFDPIDLARGGYNPPHCYERPYLDLDTDISFHIAVKKRK